MAPVGPINPKSFVGWEAGSLDNPLAARSVCPLWASACGPRGDIGAMVERMTSAEHDCCEMALAMAKDALSS